MIKQKYSFSDFRHHVGYSLAMAGPSAEEIAYILGHSSVVTARHYIFFYSELAQIRAQALGKNSLYRQMIAMLMTGRTKFIKKIAIRKKFLEILVAKFITILVGVLTKTNVYFNLYVTAMVVCTFILLLMLIIVMF